MTALRIERDGDAAPRRDGAPRTAQRVRRRADRRADRRVRRRRRRARGACCGRRPVVLGGRRRRVDALVGRRCPTTRTSPTRCACARCWTRSTAAPRRSSPGCRVTRSAAAAASSRAATSSSPSRRAVRVQRGEARHRPGGDLAVRAREDRPERRPALLRHRRAVRCATALRIGLVHEVAADLDAAVRADRERAARRRPRGDPSGEGSGARAAVGRRDGTDDRRAPDERRGPGGPARVPREAPGLRGAPTNRPSNNLALTRGSQLAVRRLLFLTSAVVFFDTLFFAALTPLLPHYADTLHLSETGAGVLAAAYPAGVIVGAIPSGMVAARGRRQADGDRRAERGRALHVLFGIGDTAWQLVTARFVQGLSSAFTWTGALAWLDLGRACRAARHADRARVRRRGLRRAGRAGAGRHRVGRGNRLDVRRRRRRVARRSSAGPRPFPPSARPDASRLGVLGHALRDRRILGGFWFVVLPALLFGTLSVLGPLRLSDLGLGSVAIGAVFLCSAAVEAANNIYVGRVSDRSGPVRPLVFGLIASAVVAALLPWPDRALWLAVLVVCGGFAFGMFFTPGMTLLTQLSEARGLDYGYTFALMSLAWAPGQALGAAGGGALAHATTNAVPYLVLGGCLLPDPRPPLAVAGNDRLGPAAGPSSLGRACRYRGRGRTSDLLAASRSALHRKGTPHRDTPRARSRRAGCHRRPARREAGAARIRLELIPRPAARRAVRRRDLVRHRLRNRPPRRARTAGTRANQQPEPVEPENQPVLKLADPIVDGTGTDPLAPLAGLEEQWARLAAAEARVAEMESELDAMREKYEHAEPRAPKTAPRGSVARATAASPAPS